MCALGVSVTDKLLIIIGDVRVQSTVGRVVTAIWVKGTMRHVGGRI
jgi:hypothetical protein